MGVFTEVAERFRGNGGKQVEYLTPTLNEMVLATSKAMDILEGKPFRSGIKVALIAGAIANGLRLPERDAASVVYAALLHDIGLIKITADVYAHLPSGITEKQIFHNHSRLAAGLMNAAEPLSAELRDRLHQHPLAAGNIVRALGLSEEVIDIIGAHHELCDGSGYPHGLSELQIPLGAKILAFADVAESIMAEVTTGIDSRREALEHFMDVQAVDKFDERVISAFRRFINEDEDFLRRLGTLEVEVMVASLLPRRSTPLSGQALLSIVRVLGSLSDAVMPLYKSERSQQVAQTAIRLAASLGIYREQCGELAIAAMLMDLGHLGTPIGLLLKPAPLTAEERAVMQDHPILTREILKGLSGFENIVLWCSEHHERMNGKGYPGSKKGFEISIGGRILALADVFDALTSRRPHRVMAMSPMDALPIIGQGRMTMYDHRLVTQLRRVVMESELVVH